MANTNKEKLTTKETIIQIAKFVAFSMGAGLRFACAVKGVF